MRIKLKYLLIIVFCLGAASCKKDNYKAPSSLLSGNLVYNGESIGVEQYQVPYQLYQYGFGLVGPIGSSFAQDGSYSALLFDGDYKFIIPNGQGPFQWKYLPSGAPDSLSITVKGNQTQDIEVTPYYMIRNPQITGTSGNVTATFKAEQIIMGANAKSIERVSLYINKTQFVSGNNDQKIANADMDGASITDPNNISLSVAIPTIVPTQNYIFARVGIKIAGVEDMILSPVQKISY